MKILICSPGSWRYGLNSPERGEGRWSQNYIAMLAKAGHQIYGASAGGELVHQHGNPMLIHEKIAKQFEPYDLYFDAAWWEGKKPLAEAKKYIHIHWSLEERIKSSLPENHYIGFPYRDSIPRFMIPGVNQNLDRTFLLPTYFIDQFPEPKFDNTRIFSSARDVKNEGREGECVTAILNFLVGQKIPMVSILSQHLKMNYPVYADYFKQYGTFRQGLPYNQVWDLIKTAKINIPLLGQACTLDATFNGVPTLMWEEGGFFTHIADRHGFLIKKTDNANEIQKKAYILWNDEQKYLNYLSDLQNYLNDHLYENALNHFNTMIEKIF